MISTLSLLEIILLCLDYLNTLFVKGLSSRFMNEDTARELASLRRQNQILHRNLQRLESELFDTRLELESLNGHKRGRWVGFALILLATLLFGLILIPYLEFNATSLNSDNSDYVLNSLSFSVSTTALLFGGVLELGLIAWSIIQGSIVIAQLGSSSLARALSKMYRLVNYPEAIHFANARLSIQLSELDQLKKDIETIEPRLNELEFLETPWDADL